MVLYSWLVRRMRCEVPSSISGDITSLFQLLSFPCSFDGFEIPLKRSIDGGGGGGLNERAVDLKFVSYYCYELST